MKRIGYVTLVNSYTKFPPSTVARAFKLDARNRQPEGIVVVPSEPVLELLAEVLT
jgi:hypothetical protein